MDEARAAEDSEDDRLLARARAGDETAFRALYQRHHRQVFRFAYRMTGRTDAAEDITHDCFASLIDRLDRFNPTRASLRTYLCGTARNLALDRFRRSGRHVALEETAAAAIPERAEGPLERLLAEETSALVQRAVGTLPPLQREALVLFEYEELSLEEIAGLVDAEVGSVKSRLHRARERLRQLLAPDLGPEARQAIGARKR